MTVVVTGGFDVVVGAPHGVATARRGRARRAESLVNIILTEEAVEVGELLVVRLIILANYRAPFIHERLVRATYDAFV